MVGMPVLGLAGCHWRQIGKWKLQVRFHPRAVYSLRWPGQTVMGSWPPGVWKTQQPYVLKKWKMKNRCTATATGRSFTSLQMFHTHTDTRVYTHRERECVCVCAEGLKLSKKAHRKIRVLVSITNLTRMYGGDANDGMPSHHEWTNLGGDDSRDACGSYCILLIQLFYRYFGGTQKWKTSTPAEKNLPRSCLNQTSIYSNKCINK